VKQTTKECPKCKNTALILLTSLNKKLCSVCGEEIDWYLDPGQKPLFEGTKPDQK